MSKFKVGDKVRILHSDYDNGFVGKIAVVPRVSKNGLVYFHCTETRPMGWCYYDCELELVKDIPIETNTEVYYIPKSMIDEINGAVSTINEKEEFIPDETQAKYWKDYYESNYYDVKMVIYHEPKTTVILKSGERATTVCNESDFDYEKGFLYAYRGVIQKYIKHISNTHDLNVVYSGNDQKISVYIDSIERT